MCDFNIHLPIEITVNGSSFGFTCDQTFAVNCQNAPGTYRIYMLNGTVTFCSPDQEEGSCPLDWNHPAVESTKVFCDPCLDRCSTDGRSLRYTGDMQWLFTTYVDRAPNPVPIPLGSFTLTRIDGTPSNPNGSASVNGVECCCGIFAFRNVYLSAVTLDLQSLIASTDQYYLVNSNGLNPEEACKCGCPNGPLNCIPSIGDCGNNIFSLLYQYEVSRLDTLCQPVGGDNTVTR